MRKFILTILAAMMAVSAHAQGGDLPSDAKAKLNSAIKNGGSTLGTFFVLGFPPNEVETQPKQDLAFYVGTAEETTVTLSNSTGEFYTTKLPANSVGTFSSSGNPGTHPFSWGYENWEHERVVQNKTVMVEADRPVSVYVMNSKLTTSEGYLAIPVNSWGKEYIHCSFWDFYEGRLRGGGFQVMAAEDDTRITIKLNGMGESVGETVKGKTIGETVRVTLDKGDLYQIQGSGETRGVFDLSGSSIVANKPIGVISYHNRTMIPKQIVWNGRDQLISMMPPVQAWGRRYASVEMDRKTGRGDYFRVVSSADDNEVTFSWYDINTNQLTQSINATLQAGDVWTPYEVDGDYNNNPPLIGVNGTMIVEAEEPILLMQYAYSAYWDSQSSEFDPFMFPVTAVEQYTFATIFQSPKNYATVAGQEYNNNFFNLLFLGDPDGVAAETRRLAESIYIDGQQLTAIDPTAGLKKIPNTNIYFSRIKVEQGVHRIYGETPFGAYIYGFSSFDSYAWPAATNYFNLSEYDPWAPEVEVVDECDVFYFDVTDNKPEVVTGDLIEVDLGISYKPEVIASDNFLIGEDDVVAVDKETRDETEYLAGLALEEISWRYMVEDPYKDASLTLRFNDAYNYPNIDSTHTDTTVNYIADKITFTDEDDLNFEQVRVDTEKITDFLVTIDNIDMATFSGIDASGIYLKKGKEFTVEVLEQDDREIPLKVTYKPTMEYIDLPEDQRYTDEEQKFDYDTLVIETGCLVWEYELRGQGVLPQLVVRDWNAGTTQPNTPLVYKELGNAGIVNYRMRNAGTMETSVTGITEVYEVDANKVRTSGNLVTAGTLTTWQELNDILEGFEFTANVTPLNSITIEKANIIDGTPTELPTGTLRFETPNTGEYRYEIVFENNAGQKKEYKPNAYWGANVTNSQLITTNLDYPEVRALSYNAENTLDRVILDDQGNEVGTEDMNGFIRLTNAGTAPLSVFGVTIVGDAEGHFMFDKDLGTNGDDSYNRWFPTIDGDQNTGYSPDNFSELLGTFASSNQRYVLEANEANSMMVPIVFNPQRASDAGEVFTAEVEIYGRNFNTNDPIEKIGTATVTGSAFLPEIDVIGYTFAGKTIEGERSVDESGVITISNPGSHVLTVFKFDDGANGIFSGNDPNDFSVADFTATPKDYDVNANDAFFPVGTKVEIPINGSITVPVAFMPEEIGKQDRSATFTVLSDAIASQDNPNNRDDFDNDDVIEDNLRPNNGPQQSQPTTRLVEASAFSTGTSTFLGFDSPTTTGCDILEGDLVLTNTDPSSDIYLFDVPLVPIVTALDGENTAGIDWSEIITYDADDYDANTPVENGDPRVIELTLDPTLLPAQVFGADDEVRLEITYDLDYEYDGSGPDRETGTFVITPTVVTVTRTSVAFDITSHNGVGSPGQNAEMKVTVSSPDWGVADITEMTVYFNYNSNMFFMDDEQATDNNVLPAGWEYDPLTSTGGTVDDPIRRVKVTARSTNDSPWPANQDFFRPQFVFLIHDDWGAEGKADGEDVFLEIVELESENTFADRGGCVAGSWTPGEALTDYCSPKNMNVKLVDPNAAASMAVISPNPVNTDVFTLDYSVRISGPVEISLIDTKGQVVSVPFSGQQTDGEYTLEISTDMLSAGVYQLVYKSAAYSATQPVNIVK